MKFVFCQISNKLLDPIPDKLSEAFYTTKEKDGYYRPEHFWELPKWIAEMCFAIPDGYDKELLIIEKEDTPEIIPEIGTYYCFSVLDVNLKYIEKIIENNQRANFVLGGYVDSRIFDKYNNVLWFNNIKEFADTHGFSYRYGCDWSLFRGTRCIPRLTMSKGCLNGCKFCTVPRGLTEISNLDIIMQIHAFGCLKYKLIYIDDKTFGQAENCEILNNLYNIVKADNPEFEGFIIQTTAREVLKRKCDKEFWECIRVVEIGVETLNNDILGAYRKPHTVNEILRATMILKYLHGIRVIWNIIIGFSEETEDTYEHTIAVINVWSEDLYGLNIYHLAMYGTGKDTDENSNCKSWMTPFQKGIADKFEELLHSLGLGIIENEI